ISAIVQGHVKRHQRPTIECAHADTPQTISPSTGSSTSNVAHEPCSPPTLCDISITLNVAVRCPLPSRGWKVTSTFSPWLALRKSHKPCVTVQSWIPEIANVHDGLSTSDTVLPLSSFNCSTCVSGTSSARDSSSA